MVNVLQVSYQTMQPFNRSSGQISQTANGSTAHEAEFDRKVRCGFTRALVKRRYGHDKSFHPLSNRVHLVRNFQFHSAAGVQTNNLYTYFWFPYVSYRCVLCEQDTTLSIMRSWSSLFPRHLLASSFRVRYLSQSLSNQRRRTPGMPFFSRFCSKKQA